MKKYHDLIFVLLQMTRLKLDLMVSSSTHHSPGSIFGRCPTSPLGTPPSTPPIPKGTPPRTPPTNDSPSTQARGLTEGEESEDGLTLEELEEQQRLLWQPLRRQIPQPTVILKLELLRPPSQVPLVSSLHLNLTRRRRRKDGGLESCI